MIFHCTEGNDLFKTLASKLPEIKRVSSFSKALSSAEEGEGILSLADNYPVLRNKVTEAQLRLIRQKKLRVYIEYPQTIGKHFYGAPVKITHERIVISSDFFSPELKEMSLLIQHGCWHVLHNTDKAHLILSKVAGYSEAVFGLPAEKSALLFEEEGLLVAASKLSGFITGRYAPAFKWEIVLRKILQWVAPADNIGKLLWEPAVKTRAKKSEILPNGFERQAFNKSKEWFDKYAVMNMFSGLTISEGLESAISHDGLQRQRPFLRADCLAESAIVFALDWKINKNPDSLCKAVRMIDCAWSSPFFFIDDQGHPAYGHSSWVQCVRVFYTDDNARVILATIAVRNILNETKWDSFIIKCILANFRTSGQMGFRRNFLTDEDFFTENKTWLFYNNENFVSFAPHHQAYIWCCYLWLYAITGKIELFRKSHNAIKMTMDKYPDWQWTNGLTQEIARMLLPLAFLLKLENTPEHRKWLDFLAAELIKYQEPCGAIREGLGCIESGKYPPPRSNDDFGTREASLIQKEGDPATDLLYTDNFALLGLHEAFSVTRNSQYKNAEDKLTEFLARIQICSEQQPYTNGAWMRCFDYELWEYWGSSADASWGAWCVETGWTNSWIAALYGTRLSKTQLFATSNRGKIPQLFPEIWEDMMNARKLDPHKKNYSAALPGW